MKSVDSYDYARMYFRSGDIVFFSKGKKNLIRRIITWFSGGPYYHVGIAFWVCLEGGNRLLLAESQPDGYRLINLGFYEDRDMTVFKCPVSWSKIEEIVVNSTGESYNFIDMALIGFHEKFNTPIPSSAGAGEVCSVIVSKILQQGGLTGIDTMVSPQKLFEQLSLTSSPAFVIQN